MTCEICNKTHETIDHFNETNPLDIIIEETHNPLDIPFGHEVHEMEEDQLIKVEDGKGATVLDEWGTQEVNNNIKSDPTEEGGLGSGRNPESPGDVSGGGPGPLVTFETTIIKEMLDAKLNCPCNKNK